MASEKIQPTENPLRTFADEATTFYLFLLTCSLPAIISSVIDINLGQIALATGGIATAASFTMGRIINRNRHEDNRPKPLATENMPNKPVTIVSFKPANATG